MRYTLAILITFALYYSGLGAAYALSVETVDQLDIKAIKSINLIQNENEFRAAVVVQFGTTANSQIKFRKANFVITLDDGTKQPILLGHTESEEMLFPASKKGLEKLTEETLNVFVGKNEINTINRLIQLFNLIANPDAEFTMRLSGTTEVGTKAKRGWIYQGEVEIEEFTFHPTIQREVLFK
jgi:carboxylesterase type B